MVPRQARDVGDRTPTGLRSADKPVDWWRFKDVVSREEGLLAAQRRDRHLPWCPF